MKENPLEDGLLRQYLLGELSQEEAEALERRFGDDEFFELVEAVEADLLAAAARGELAPAERERVLKRLASSPQGRERFALARALNATADQEYRQAEVVRFPRRAAIWKPAAWSALAASLLAVIGLALFMPDDRDAGGETPIETSDVQNPAGPVLPKTPQDRRAAPQVNTAPTPAPVISEEPPVAEPEEPLVAEPVKPLRQAVLQLALIGDLREGGEVEKLDLTPDVGTVKIQIYLAGGQEDFESFNVALRKDQDTVWQQNRLKPQQVGKQLALVLEVPAENLATAGRYEAEVQGVAVEGEPKPPSFVEFEVETGGQP